MPYNNLPGLQVFTNDGGLAATNTPSSKSTVVIGTSASGPFDAPYQVADRAVAAQLFGLQGTLIQSMEEVAQGGCDNILLLRIGVKQATLSNIGTVLVDTGQKDANNHAILAPKDANNVGFTITFGTVDPNIAANYQVYYNGTGLLNIFYKGSLVYSNDPQNLVDTGDCAVTGIAVGGSTIQINGTPNGSSNYAKSAALSNSVIAASTSSTDSDTNTLPALELYLGDTGLSLAPTSNGFDPCKLYEAQQLAYANMEVMPVQQVVVPNAYFDTPNVAFYSSTDGATSVNNPANGSALGWLQTTYDAFGTPVFRWAHKLTDSTGAAVTLPTFVSAADRIAQGFHEVSFPYQLARFCAKQSQYQGGCVGFIGFNPPKNYKPAALKTWIGYLPSVDANGNPSTAGTGLCGQPYLVGTTSGKLNSLCADVAVQAYRTAGLFQSTSAEQPNELGEYDEGVVIDANGYQVDIGRYIQPVADWALLSNGYSRTYANNIAGAAAGYCSRLDEKLGLTNKTLPGVTQIYRVTMAQMDSLTAAKVNVLKFKGDNVAPALLHDRSAANNNSDYIFLFYSRIEFKVTTVLFQEADKFVGTSATDGLSMAALTTAIEKKLQVLQKNGYISNYNYNVYSTAADQRLGKITIKLSFAPARELVQINAQVSAGS
jgi:hypothetical protein